MVFEGCCIRSSSKIHPKFTLENERFQILQKVVFLMILGIVLGAKSIQQCIKIDIEIQVKIRLEFGYQFWSKKMLPRRNLGLRLTLAQWRPTIFGGQSCPETKFHTKVLKGLRGRRADYLTRLQGWRIVSYLLDIVQLFFMYCFVIF